MKVGILGSGAVGSRLAALFQASGHDVVVGSRSSDNSSHQDAITHGDVVVLAVPFVVLKDMLPPLASALAGKIVMDASNPLKDDWSPVELSGTSGAEEVAKLLPESTIVKAFNTIFADVMMTDVIAAHDDISAFVASDDQAAMDVVAKLALECGFLPVKISKLSAARYLEAMAHLNIELAIGKNGGGTHAFFTLKRFD